jgi:hypothetical protein
MRGRTTQHRPSLTPLERQQLHGMQQDNRLTAKVRRRAALVLYIAGGMTITDTATMVNMSRRYAYAWLHAFANEGTRGLYGVVMRRQDLP